MEMVLSELHSKSNADRVLVEELATDHTVRRTHSYGQIIEQASALAPVIDRHRGTRPLTVGLVAANTVEWIVADLALLHLPDIEIPVPLTFSGEQAAAMIGQVDICLVDRHGAAKLAEWNLSHSIPIVSIEDAIAERRSDTTLLADHPSISDAVIKTIHTSGTTGLPKGVMIRDAGLQALLDSLRTVIPAHTYQRYLSLVPLSLLIEQVVAIYLPILHRGRVVLLPDSDPLLGTAGSRAADVVGWMRAIRPSASVLTPAAVAALDKAITSQSDVAEIFGEQTPFLMAGGAPVDPATLERLAGHGVDVHEGYGLSENSSVVSWNRPGQVRFGSAGQPLPHCEVRLDDSGELLVRSSSLFAGYSVEDPTSKPLDSDGWLHTGDIARIDDDGYLFLLGRAKNTIITANGRNVSPEWVEGRLRSAPEVNDCVLFGNELEHVVAVVLHDPSVDATDLSEGVLRYSADHLAETDRPDRIITLPDTASIRERFFTVTGRPRRGELFDAHVAPVLAG